VSVRGPILAAERTALAWQRSALSTAAAAAVLLRIAERHSPSGVSAATGAAALVLAAAMAFYGRRRYRAGDTTARPAVNRAIAVAVAALGVASAVSVLLAVA
jgi:uncharacterized membrane protein YidH (DUF202 family)